MPALWGYEGSVDVQRHGVYTGDAGSSTVSAGCGNARMGASLTKV